ncbi:hypothetical protein ACS0TY_023378 [Phlomoides rotata]
MAVYAEVVSLLFRISRVIEKVDVLLSLPSLKILKLAEKELKCFRNFVEGLNSKSKERMSASIQGIFDIIVAHIIEYSYMYDDLNIIVDGEGFEDLSRGIHSLAEQLKKVRNEYYTLQEDDQKEVVSSSSTRVVSKSKMVGIGKTTLAREIFEDLDIIEWFECRVWVEAGFEWREGGTRKSEDITECILAQVDPMGKRYLIVLDDVWNERVDTFLESSFPDNQNGSHVVLISRLKDTCLYVFVDNFIDMQLLDKEESWDLLRQKVFVGVSCPPHLEEAGKKITEKCDGLPLTIVTIADLLSKVPESLWIDVATKRKHKLFVDAYDQISQFLRRLDALNIHFHDFPLEVLKLVKLRYLALTYNGILPPSISDLRKLQYLIVHPHLSIKPFGALFNLPMEIWDMKRLKHLQVTGYDLPNLGDTSFYMVLNRVSNLKKLGIKIELAPDAADPLYCFGHISHLTKLESLKCVIVNPEFKLGIVSPVLSFPCFSFCLKELSLSGMGYSWKEMSNIASMPNLEVLKLRFNGLRGPEWELEENRFPNLQALLSEYIDLVKLKWAHGSFKSLTFLRIKHYKLEELHLGDLPKIFEIEVVDCNVTAFVGPVREIVTIIESLHKNLGEFSLAITSKIVDLDRNVREVKEAQETDRIKTECQCLTEAFDAEKQALTENFNAKYDALISIVGESNMLLIAEHTKMDAQLKEERSRIAAERASLKAQEDMAVFQQSTDTLSAQFFEKYQAKVTEKESTNNNY